MDVLPSSVAVKHRSPSPCIPVAHSLRSSKHRRLASRLSACSKGTALSEAAKRIAEPPAETHDSRQPHCGNSASSRLESASSTRSAPHIFAAANPTADTLARGGKSRRPQAVAAGFAAAKKILCVICARATPGSAGPSQGVFCSCKSYGGPGTQHGIKAASIFCTCKSASEAAASAPLNQHSRCSRRWNIFAAANLPVTRKRLRRRPTTAHHHRGTF